MTVKAQTEMGSIEEFEGRYEKYEVRVYWI